MDAHEGKTETWFEQKRRPATVPSKVRSFRRTEAISIAIQSEASKVRPRSAWQLAAFFQGFAPRLPCPVLECSSQKTLDFWGKPPQPTSKSQRCFHFQLKEDCDNSKCNPLGIHKGTQQIHHRRASSHSNHSVVHPFPRNRPPKPQPLVRGNLHQRSREGWRTARKKHRLRQKCRPPCASRETLHDCLMWPRCEEALTSCAQSATIDKTRTASPRLEARNTGSPAWKKQDFYEDHTDPKPARKLLPKMATAAKQMQVEASLGLPPSLPKCCLSLVGYPLADPFVGSLSCRHPARRGYSTVGLLKPADQCAWEHVETSWV